MGTPNLPPSSGSPQPRTFLPYHPDGLAPHPAERAILRPGDGVLHSGFTPNPIEPERCELCRRRLRPRRDSRRNSGPTLGACERCRVTVHFDCQIADLPAAERYLLDHTDQDFLVLCRRCRS